MRFGRSIEAEEFLEQGKLEFRDAKSSSVSSPGQTGGQWGEDEGRKPEKTSICGGVAEKREREGTAEKRERYPRNIYCHLLYHLPTDSLPELVNTS